MPMSGRRIGEDAIGRRSFATGAWGLSLDWLRYMVVRELAKRLSPSLREVADVIVEGEHRVETNGGGTTSGSRDARGSGHGRARRPAAVPAPA
jgi:hypothetical protein